MKKLFAATLALLAIAAGCQKEIDEKTASAGRIPVVISPEFDESETKTVFEDAPGTGKQFIAWESGDQIDVTVMESSASDASVVQGWGNGAFTMGSDVTNPSFSGYFYNSGHKPSEVLYAVYPYDRSNRWMEGPKQVAINLPEVQTPTQKGFDGKADVMVSQCYPLGEELAKTYPVEGGEMYVMAPVALKLKFAHVYGFGRLAFDCTQHQEEKVKYVEIKSKKIAGNFYVDMTSGFSDLKLTVNDSVDKLTIQSDGTVALKDYVCWFVAAPGTYEDVHVMVYTDKGILAYDRNTLQIVRAHITRKTIHSTTNDDVSKRTLLRSFKVRRSQNTYDITNYGLEFDASNRLLALLQSGYPQWTVSYPDANTLVYERYGTEYKATLNSTGQITSIVRNASEYKEQYSFTYSGKQLTQQDYTTWNKGVASPTNTVKFAWSGSELTQIEEQSGSILERRQTVTSGTAEDNFNLTAVLLSDSFLSTPGPVEMLLATTNSFHTKYIPSQVVNNNLQTETTSVDKYLATVDANGLVTALKYYKNNICKASATFSYTLEEAPDPDFPENPVFPGAEAKLPRHLIRKDASGNRDVMDLTYDEGGRLTQFKRTGSSGPLTANFAWGETSATVSINDNGSASSYTYALSDGKVTSATGAHQLEKSTGYWGDVCLKFDGNQVGTPYNGDFVDSKGGIGIAYVLSECPGWGPALLPVLQGMDVSTHFNSGRVPTYFYQKEGGTETIIKWLLRADDDGDLSDVVTVKDGKTVASLSISYSDLAPSEPFLLPASPTVTGKKICQVESNWGGDPSVDTYYYDSKGDLWIVKDRESITVFTTSGTRTTGLQYNQNLSRDSETKIVIDRDASGHPVKMITGGQAMQFDWSGDNLSSIYNGNSSTSFEWTDGNVTKVIQSSPGYSSTMEITYGTLTDKVGVFANAVMGSSAYAMLLGLSTKNAPVKMQEMDEGTPVFEHSFQYETDTDGDITRVRHYVARAGMQRLQEQTRYFYNYNPIPKDGATVNGGASGEDYDVKPL